MKGWLANMTSMRFLEKNSPVQVPTDRKGGRSSAIERQRDGSSGVTRKGDVDVDLSFGVTEPYVDNLQFKFVEHYNSVLTSKYNQFDIVQDLNCPFADHRFHLWRTRAGTKASWFGKDYASTNGSNLFRHFFEYDCLKVRHKKNYSDLISTDNQLSDEQVKMIPFVVSHYTAGCSVRLFTDTFLHSYLKHIEQSIIQTLGPSAVSKGHVNVVEVCREIYGYNVSDDLMLELITSVCKKVFGKGSTEIIGADAIGTKLYYKIRPHHLDDQEFPQNKNSRVTSYIELKVYKKGDRIRVEFRAVRVKLSGTKSTNLTSIDELHAQIKATCLVLASKLARLDLQIKGAWRDHKAINEKAYKLEKLKIAVQKICPNSTNNELYKKLVNLLVNDQTVNVKDLRKENKKYDSPIKQLIREKIIVSSYRNRSLRSVDWDRVAEILDPHWSKAVHQKHNKLSKLQEILIYRAMGSSLGEDHFNQFLKKFSS